ncbi:uncharacterized protein C5orf34 homolog [Stegastes partitus]|uniref:Uncharacterized protein C5orf34 homolog n=1 Tax=Stegastes partitus TaxID=144197 RepID=A0A3B5AD53_9TELE|nr:PREDICTED: uncharacterized protein C5orf34 homolog [Stegastes partitus]
METDAGVSLMIMYEDESVDVRYGNGAQLQLSPCGCEFTLVKPADPRGLLPPDRVRQRSRFTISTYKELMVAALAFRNNYASRPYLPEELTPADLKKPFFSIDSAVQWPEPLSYQAVLGPGGETIVRSEEGRAALVLSPSGEEFSVEFTCSLSRNQHHDMQRLNRDGGEQQASNRICDSTSDRTEEVHQGGRSGRKNLTRSRSPQMVSTAQPKPEQIYQSTTVVQHHSCCAVDPVWAYPLSLAHYHWTARLSKSKDVGTERGSNSSLVDRRINTLDIPSEERKTHLPQALPLTCPSPHRHRWKVKDPLAKEEHSDLPTEPVKIIWCQGVTYRILSGAVSVIEVSPGDGSIIRSNGVLTSYFTHLKPELQSVQVKEVTYFLNSLPPDVLGQAYSVCSIVSRASRILTCYNQAKESLKLPATPSCLQAVKQDIHFSKPAPLEENLSNAVQHIHLTETADTVSDLVAAELEKIKRFNFLLENSHLLRNKKGHADLEGSSAEVTHEPVNENCIAEALQRTSKAIQDIDALISATALT